MSRIFLVANTDWFLYNFRLSLARYLRSQGREVVLVSPTGPYVPSLQAEGFRHLPWEVGRQSTSLFSEARAVLALARLFSRQRPDLVHLHTVKPVLYGSLASWLVGLPRVVRSITGRGYVFLRQEPKARLLRPVVILLYRLLLSGQRGWTIFENEQDRSFFIGKGLVRAGRSSLVEGAGVDTSFFSPLPEPEGVPVILLPARLLWDKGVGTLVDAARLLHSQVKVRVVLVGEPDEGNPASIPLEQLRQWQAEKVVEWWGWQTDMRSAYARSHIITLPSLGEGIPTALLEAAACARPIVTTDVPGCREVVQDGLNGLLVPSSDAPALASALAALATDPSLRLRMGMAGRHRVESRFAGTVINARTNDVYEELLRA